MKFQWTFVLGLIFAIIIAIFAVVNVEAVRVNYVFGYAMWPLILVILGSALLGALTSGLITVFRGLQSHRQVKELQHKIETLERTIMTQQSELDTLQKLQKVK